MDRFYAEEFCNVSNALGMSRLITVDHPVFRSLQYQSARTHVEGIRDRLIAIRDGVKSLCPLSAKYIDDTYLPAINDSLTMGKWNNLNETLELRIRDELSLQLLLHVPIDRARYCTEPLADWADGLAKFPSISFDAEEASRCYALGRFTAAVFHMMRVLEAPLAVIARSLEVTKPSPTWNAYLEAFKVAAAKKYPSPHGYDRKMRDYFSGLEAQLRAVKDAFRNPTIHSLDRTYTGEMAHEILVLLRGFLREAGKELSE